MATPEAVVLEEVSAAETKEETPVSEESVKLPNGGAASQTAEDIVKDWGKMTKEAPVQPKEEDAE